MKNLLLLFFTLSAFGIKAQQVDTLYYEPFDDNRHHWTLEQTTKTQMRIADGKMHVRNSVRGKHHYIFHTFQPGIVTDTFTLRMLLIPDTMKYGGMIYKCFRKEDGSMDYYGGFVREKKYYSNYSYSFRSKTFQWLGTKKTLNDMNAPVLFEMQARGRKLDFYANGVYQYTETLGKGISLKEFGWVSRGPSSFAIEEIVILK